jgi:hypothetical protein
MEAARSWPAVSSRSRSCKVVRIYGSPIQFGHLASGSTLPVSSQGKAVRIQIAPESALVHQLRNPFRLDSCHLVAAGGRRKSTRMARRLAAGLMDPASPDQHRKFRASGSPDHRAPVPFQEREPIADGVGGSGDSPHCGPRPGRSGLASAPQVPHAEFGQAGIRQAASLSLKAGRHPCDEI